MKKYIEGRAYDTETAVKIGSHSETIDGSDYRSYKESLFRKVTGEYFLAGEGGSLSPYGKIRGREMCSGRKIIPLNDEEAKYWIKKYLGLDISAYEKPDIGVVDHQGNQYATITEMCQAYDIAPMTFKKRLDFGWDLEAALTIPVKHLSRYHVMDHEGNAFHNIDEMCNYWCINRKLYNERVNEGWSSERALTTPPNYRRRAIKDPISGIEYESFRALCRHHKKCNTTIIARMKKGMSLEEALTRP